MTGPGSIRIVPGAHAIRTGAEILDDGPARLVDELGELESESDFMLVDAGSGLGPGATRLAAAADSAVIVTTPEPTSLADAHAAIGRFRRLPAPPRLRVVVNQARTAAEATEVLDRLVASSRQFLGVVVSPLGPGAVRADPYVGLAVRGRSPFVSAYPARPPRGASDGSPAHWSASAPNRNTAAGGPASSPASPPDGPWDSSPPGDVIAVIGRARLRRSHRRIRLERSGPSR